MLFLASNKDLYMRAKHKSFDAYIMRSAGILFFDGTFVNFDTGLAVKLPGILFVLPIFHRNLTQWESLEITKGGKTSTRQNVNPDLGIYDFIYDTVEYAFSFPLSRIQMENIEKTLFNNSKKLYSSNSWVSFLVDQKRQGDPSSPIISSEEKNSKK